eukprot:TRINITY_DN11907_c1_g3_i1.p2 TRINITY_DN11907_c1_g3~~TRINITY_DN11907_c1_g3_i1.p2  ORF type:complete len:137 (+),score=16.96 TRINITY_DN11907_c1_g3_i1:29-412(+)
MAAAVLLWLCAGATKQACDGGASPQCAYSLENPSADTMSGVISKDGTMLAMATKVGTYVANIETGVEVWSEASATVVQYAGDCHRVGDRSGYQGCGPYELGDRMAGHVGGSIRGGLLTRRDEGGLRA